MRGKLPCSQGVALWTSQGQSRPGAPTLWAGKVGPEPVRPFQCKSHPQWDFPHCLEPLSGTSTQTHLCIYIYIYIYMQPPHPPKPPPHNCTESTTMRPHHRLCLRCHSYSWPPATVATPLPAWWQGWHSCCTPSLASSGWGGGGRLGLTAA